VMAAGFLTLTIWQLMEAVVGRDDPLREGGVKGRGRSAGRAAVYLALGLLAIGVSIGAASGSEQREETLSAKLMSLPFGQLLVGLVGAGVLAIGIAQIVKGVRQTFVDDLILGVSRGILRLGSAGYICKGIALAMSGGLFGWAALTHDPDKAGGWTTLSRQPEISHLAQFCLWRLPSESPASGSTASFGRGSPAFDTGQLLAAVWMRILRHLDHAVHLSLRTRTSTTRPAITCTGAFEALA